MPSPLRLRRIADRIRQLLSEMLITGQINDPRLVDVFITDVKVDRELSFANIYVSSLEGKEQEQEIMNGFNHAAGYLRSVLAKEIQLRSFPTLRFFWDETPERAERIEQLIDSLSESEEDGGKEDSDN